MAETTEGESMNFCEEKKPNQLNQATETPPASEASNAQSEGTRDKDKGEEKEVEIEIDVDETSDATTSKQAEEGNEHEGGAEGEGIELASQNIDKQGKEKQPIETVEPEVGGEDFAKSELGDKTQEKLNNTDDSVQKKDNEEGKMDQDDNKKDDDWGEDETKQSKDNTDTQQGKENVNDEWGEEKEKESKKKSVWEIGSNNNGGWSKTTSVWENGNNSNNNNDTSSGWTNTTNSNATTTTTTFQSNFENTDNNTNRKIMCGGLPTTITESDLREAMKKYGNITNIYIPKDRETMKQRDFGFVEFETHDEAEKLASERNIQLGDNSVRVSWARPKMGGGGFSGGGFTRNNNNNNNTKSNNDIQRKRGDDNYNNDNESGDKGNWKKKWTEMENVESHKEQQKNNGEYEASTPKRPKYIGKEQKKGFDSPPNSPEILIQTQPTKHYTQLETSFPQASPLMPYQQAIQSMPQVNFPFQVMNMNPYTPNIMPVPYYSQQPFVQQPTYSNTSSNSMMFTATTNSIFSTPFGAYNYNNISPYMSPYAYNSPLTPQVYTGMPLIGAPTQFVNPQVSNTFTNSTPSTNSQTSQSTAGKSDNQYGEHFWRGEFRSNSTNYWNGFAEVDSTQHFFVRLPKILDSDLQCSSEAAQTYTTNMTSINATILSFYPEELSKERFKKYMESKKATSKAPMINLNGNINGNKYVIYFLPEITKRLSEFLFEQFGVLVAEQDVATFNKVHALLVKKSS